MSRITAMSQVTTLTGLEFLEVVQLGSADNYDEAVANGYTGTLAEWQTVYINMRATVNQLLAGVSGQSAYETAVANGFVGTEAEWVESLKGKSAYQAAVDLGYSGTELEWVSSLQGKSAYEVAVEQGFSGTPTEWLDSLNGVDGQSAYQLAVALGFVGDETQWLASLRGDSGQSAYQAAVDGGFNGTLVEWLDSLNGTDGQSAYEIAVANGFVGTEVEWVSSLIGQSAYSLAVAGGFSGTEAEWIESLHGSDGQSAYQLAVQEGFSGTLNEWLASLNGTNGQSAYAIAVAGGFVGTEAQWLASLEGTPGLTAYEVAVQGGFAGTEAQWLDSLKGDGGQSAYELAVQLGFVGDESSWLASLNGTNGLTAYQLAVQEGFGGTLTEWLDGLVGKSAYQSALDNGFVGTEVEWLASLNGTDGKTAYQSALDNGFVGTEVEWLESINGKSAYQSALDSGFVGTEAQWIASIPGKSAYQSALDNGFVGTEAEWIESIPGQSAYQLAVANGFVGTESQWLDSLNGTPGQSAYEIAVANGFVGTEAQWLASIDGVDGVDGVTAYQGAVAEGYVGTETQFYEALANVGQSGTDTNGGVFVTNVVPINPQENVGEIVRDDTGEIILSFSTTTGALRVTVLAFSGHTTYVPDVAVEGTLVTLTPVAGQFGVFEGTVDVTVDIEEATNLTVEHADGAFQIIPITPDTLPIITRAAISSAYPGTQTELKENDQMNIVIEADQAFVAVQIDDYGIFKPDLETGLANLIQYEYTGTVADRGDVRTAYNFRVRVQKANGSWSAWYNSAAQIDQTELEDFVFLNNIRPTVTIGSVTYPGGQSALKDNEGGSVTNTVTNFDFVQYDSPNSDIGFIGLPSLYETEKDVFRNSGSYNVSTPNFRITATRTANAAVTVATAVVNIANTLPTVDITLPAARLRSGGNSGTAPQNHVVTITSDQRLLSPPTLNAPEGTWLGSWMPNGDNTVWTRQLQVHDDDAKGLFSWNSLSAISLSNRTQSTINTGQDYTIGGFVFRVLQVAAFPNREVSIGTDVVDVTKLRCTNLSKAGTGALNFTYQANTTNGVDRYTITGPTGVANPTGNLWYNADDLNASSNTSGVMEIELEEVV